MKIDQMKGSRRAILLAALIGFEKATKDAGKKCEQAFLPDMESGTQLGRIAAAKEVLPLPDDVAREWEASEPLVFMYRNALVVHARAVDKVKQAEKKLEISTSDSDELLEEIQVILRDLGDQRDLFAVLEMERNGEAVENKPDPRQLEIAPADADDETKGKFADDLRRGRAKIPRADKPKRPRD